MFESVYLNLRWTRRRDGRRDECGGKEAHLARLRGNPTWRRDTHVDVGGLNRVLAELPHTLEISVVSVKGAGGVVARVLDHPAGHGCRRVQDQ